MVKRNPLLRVSSAQRGIVRLSFPYNTALKDAIKKLPGARWFSGEKTWHVPECFLRDVHRFAVLHRLQFHDERTAPVMSADLNLLGVFDYQAAFAQRAVAERSRMCSSEMGCGKTPAALEALAQGELDANKNTLIICPGGVRTHWKKQIKKWWPDYYHELMQHKFLTLITSAKKWQDACVEGITVTSYDLVGAAPDWARQYDAIIMDESHHIKNSKTKRTKAVRDLCRQNPEALRLELTGTPFDRPADLWSQLDLLFPGRYGSYFQFAQRYADCEHNGYGWDIRGLTPNADAADELRYRLGLVADRVTKSQIAHLLPPLTVQTETVTAPRRDWSMLREGLTDPTRAHEDQIQGCLLHAGTLKTKAVRKRIEDLYAAGQSTITVVYHRSLGRDLCYDRPHWIYIDGTMPFAQREEKIALAERTKRPLIATMGSIAEGIDLTFADVAIVAEFNYKVRLMIQVLGRFHRLSSTKPVTLLFFYVEATWDEVCALAVEEKVADICSVLGGGESEAALAKAITGTTDKEAAERLHRVASQMIEGDEYL